LVTQWKIILKVGFGGFFSIMGAETGPVDAALEAALAEEVAEEAACDPDPCRIVKDYRKKIVPRYIGKTPKLSTQTLRKTFNGPVSQKTVQLYLDCLKAERSVAAHEKSVFDTVCKIYTAKKMGDKRTAEIQKHHKLFLISESAKRKKEAIDSWLALTRHMKTFGITSKPVPSPTRFLKELRTKGFPKYEVELLRANGLTETQIEFVRQKFLKLYLKGEPKSFEEGVFNIILVHADNKDMEMCKCDESLSF
jgi:hypothetical protein